jgi:hypothetical protein
LTQLNFHNWLGAVAFTVILGSILVCARRFLRRVADGGATVAAGVLVALLAVLPGRYGSDAEATALGLLAALAGGNLWLAAAGRPAALRLAVFWALALLLFYAAGTFPFGLFVVLIVGAESAANGSKPLALGCALALLLVPTWCWLRPGFNPWKATRSWGDGLSLALNVLAYLSVPLWLILRAALNAVEKAGRLRVSERLSSAGSGMRLLGWVLGLAAAAVFMWAGLDESRQALARLERAVSQQEWDAALRAAKGLRAWTASARLQVLRALSHLRRLPEDLFAYPQQQGRDVLPGYEAGLEMSRALSETLLELGQVNLAEHMAHEALELEGPRPDTLRLLAKVNLLKGHPEAAKVFLNRLRLALFHRAEAELALRALATEPDTANYPEMALFRTRLPRTDEPESSLPADRLLRQLLEANRTNRMAFDYLVAQRLLKNQLELLPVELGRLEALGETALPRPCEEALLIYQESRPGDVATLRNLPISAAARERYRRFVQLARRQPSPSAARAALAPEFGDTYWFFHLFGETAQRTTAQAAAKTP